MKKIALITFFKNNYGSILQCYATKHFVESMECKCDVICDQSLNNPSFFARIKKIPSLIIKFLNPFFLKAYKEIRFGQKCIFLSSNSKKKMDDFLFNHLHVKKLSVAKKNTLLYDWFLAGSDQIWNVKTFFYPFYFLTFAPRAKRIALAPSFGISEIPKYNQKILRKALDGFDYISVREETGVNIVKKYSNAKVCRIADPTFIYDADEWRGFAKEGIVIPQKYILVHFLNEPNEVALESMCWLSSQLNLDIVAIGYRYDSFNHLKRFAFKDGGPWDYVKMIDKAEYVITDSFHSSLFSINFNKRFFVFHRNYLASKQTSRISDLLERFGIGNRLIADIEVLKNLYLENLPVSSRSILERERTTIRDYIQKSISGQVPQCFMTEKNGKVTDD